jgi:WD40 repeat protein
VSIRVVAPRPGSKSEPVSRRLIRTLIHTDPHTVVGTVFFAADGKWIAGCGLNGNGGIQTWDAATGKQLRHIPIPDDYRSQYDPLPPPTDGHTLFVPIERSRTIRVTKDGHPAMRWEVDGELQVWDLPTGRKLPPLGHTPPCGVLGVALSTDGKTLADVERRLIDDGRRIREVLALWDIRDRTVRDLAGGRRTPSFAPDGKTLAASFVDSQSKRGALALWDVASGKRRTILHSAAAYYGTPVFSPDGRYLAIELSMPGGQAPQVRLWEVATGTEVGAFTAPEKALSFEQLAFSPDGRRLAAATIEDGKVFLYDIMARRVSWVQDLGKTAMLRDPVFSPDGGWLAVPGQPLPAGLRKILRENPLELPQPRVFFFDLAAGGEPEVVVAPHGFVGRAAFSRDGRTLALGGYGCVWLFDMAR